MPTNSPAFIAPDLFVELEQNLSRTRNFNFSSPFEHPAVKNYINQFEDKLLRHLAAKEGCDEAYLTNISRNDLHEIYSSDPRLESLCQHYNAIMRSAYAFITATVNATLHASDKTTHNAAREPLSPRLKIARQNAKRYYEKKHLALKERLVELAQTVSKWAKDLKLENLNPVSTINVSSQSTQAEITFLFQFISTLLEQIHAQSENKEAALREQAETVQNVIFSHEKQIAEFDALIQEKKAEIESQQASSPQTKSVEATANRALIIGKITTLEQEITRHEEEKGAILETLTGFKDNLSEIQQQINQHTAKWGLTGQNSLKLGHFNESLQIESNYFALLQAETQENKIKLLHLMLPSSLEAPQEPKQFAKVIHFAFLSAYQKVIIFSSEEEMELVKQDTLLNEMLDEVFNRNGDHLSLLQKLVLLPVYLLPIYFEAYCNSPAAPTNANSNSGMSLFKMPFNILEKLVALGLSIAPAWQLLPTSSQENSISDTDPLIQAQLTALGEQAKTCRTNWSQPLSATANDNYPPSLAAVPISILKEEIQVLADKLNGKRVDLLARYQEARVALPDKTAQSLEKLDILLEHMQSRLRTPSLLNQPILSSVLAFEASSSTSIIKNPQPQPFIDKAQILSLAKYEDERFFRYIHTLDDNQLSAAAGLDTAFKRRVLVYYMETGSVSAASLERDFETIRDTFTRIPLEAEMLPIQLGIKTLEALRYLSGVLPELLGKYPVLTAAVQRTPDNLYSFAYPDDGNTNETSSVSELFLELLFQNQLQTAQAKFKYFLLKHILAFKSARMDHQGGENYETRELAYTLLKLFPKTFADTLLTLDSALFLKKQNNLDRLSPILRIIHQKIGNKPDFSLDNSLSLQLSDHSEGTIRIPISSASPVESSAYYFEVDQYLAFRNHAVAPTLNQCERLKDLFVLELTANKGLPALIREKLDIYLQPAEKTLYAMRLVDLLQTMNGLLKNFDLEQGILSGMINPGHSSRSARRIDLLASLPLDDRDDLLDVLIGLYRDHLNILLERHVLNERNSCSIFHPRSNNFHNHRIESANFSEQLFYILGGDVNWPQDKKWWLTQIGLRSTTFGCALLTLALLNDPDPTIGNQLHGGFITLGLSALLHGLTQFFKNRPKIPFIQMQAHILQVLLEKRVITQVPRAFKLRWSNPYQNNQRPRNHGCLGRIRTAYPQEESWPQTLQKLSALPVKNMVGMLVCSGLIASIYNMSNWQNETGEGTHYWITNFLRETAGLSPEATGLSVSGTLLFTMIALIIFSARFMNDSYQTYVFNRELHTVKAREPNDKTNPFQAIDTFSRSQWSSPLSFESSAVSHTESSSALNKKPAREIELSPIRHPHTHEETFFARDTTVPVLQLFTNDASAEDNPDEAADAIHVERRRVHPPSLGEILRSSSSETKTSTPSVMPPSR